MRIDSARYRNDIDGNPSIINLIIDGQDMTVPIDPANRHYQAILEWVEDGNTIEDAD